MNLRNTTGNGSGWAVQTAPLADLDKKTVWTPEREGYQLQGKGGSELLRREVAPRSWTGIRAH